MARKEWVQLRRDPRSMVLAFGMPLLMLLFFGYAISWDIRDIRIAVIDQDRTASSRRLVEVFEASGYFSVVDHPETTAGIDDDLLHGRVTGGLVIPPGFARDLAAGRAAPVQLLLDGSDANTATISAVESTVMGTTHHPGSPVWRSPSSFTALCSPSAMAEKARKH